jgi:hypothetical protein
MNFFAIAGAKVTLHSTIANFSQAFIWKILPIFAKTLEVCFLEAKVFFEIDKRKKVGFVLSRNGPF